MAPQNDLFHTAARSFEAGKLREASVLLNRLVVENPDDGRTWELLGLVNWRLGRRERTQQCLETASALVPLRPEAMCGLAECYAAASKRELALLMFQGAIDDPRSGVDTLLMAAAGADAIGFPSVSIRACRTAITIDSDSAQAHYDLGYYLGRCGGSLSTIEAAARKAVQLAPEQTPYRVGLASFLQKHGRTQAAYAVVRLLSPAQVQSIGCGCCLERLAGLFDSVDDDLRAGWCRVQLDAVRARTSPRRSIEETNP